MFSIHRLVAVGCLLAVLLAELTPVPAGLFFAILLPLVLFVPAIIIAPLCRESECDNVPAYSFLSVVASRAPPKR
jgi:hypothetical protein